MGWWTSEHNGQELVLGDEPYDIMADALGSICAAYVEEWQRKPAVEEIIRTMDVVLGADLGSYVYNGEKLELVNIKARTKRRAKSQALHVGDFFSIPLEHKTYAFGRILSDFRVKDMGMLMAIYDTTAAGPIPLLSLKGAPFMFEPFFLFARGMGKWAVAYSR